MKTVFEDNSCLVDLDSGVLQVSFNRPEFGNSVPLPTVLNLIALFDEADQDPSVRVMVLRGEGKVFSTGGDVAGFARALEQGRERRQADFAQRMQRFRPLIEAVANFRKPLVVAIRGAVAGAGLLYPLSADVVIGEPDAKFVFAHQRIGLSPDGGVTALLPLAVGVRTARRLLLTAAKVDAEEALRLGLLDTIVEPGDLEEKTLAIARQLANGPQRAVQSAKRLCGMAATGAPMAKILDEEAASVVACIGDDDFAEGVRAFVEKRRPRFPSTR